MGVADNPKGFWPQYPQDARITMHPVATTQTFARGDAVILSSNQVAIAVAGSARILGVAAQACASLAANTMVAVFDDPGTRFVGRQDDTTTLTVGSEYDLVGATGVMQIDGNASSTVVFKLVGEIDPSGEADAIGKRWVFIMNKHEFGIID